MKKIIISCLLLGSSLLADCVLISSPFPQVEQIVETSFYGKHSKGLDFSEEYVKFVNELSVNAKQHCVDKKYGGIYNVKIDSVVGNGVREGFYFTASVDYVKGN